MFLYLISQSEVRGYDTYDSAVVIAASEEEARHTNFSFGWCDDPEKVDVTYLGVADPDMVATMRAYARVDSIKVCASFNAG